MSLLDEMHTLGLADCEFNRKLIADQTTNHLSGLIDALWFLRDPDGYIMNGDADVRVRLANGTLAEVLAVTIEGDAVIINLK